VLNLGRLSLTVGQLAHGEEFGPEVRMAFQTVTKARRFHEVDPDQGDRRGGAHPRKSPKSAGVVGKSDQESLALSEKGAILSPDPTEGQTRRRAMTVIEETHTVAWTAAQIEDLVIELLGAFLDEDPEQLRNKLVDKGAGMPVDSLDLFDVLQDLRKRTGLRIPVRRLRRQTMRSVKLFAKFVEQEARL